MNWEDIKGISTIVDFSDYCFENGPINRVSIFGHPDRDKYGYLWSIGAENLQGVPDMGNDIVGLLITNDMDARVVQALYNRVFLLGNRTALVKRVKELEQYVQGQKVTGKKREETLWELYKDELSGVYTREYVPVKKYLSGTVKKRIWIPLFKDYVHMDKFARKGYYQAMKLVMGDSTIILEIPDRYEKYWMWEEAIKEGPMENPELLLIEDFATDYPAAIQFIPQDIVDKLGIGFLGRMGDLGII